MNIGLCCWSRLHTSAEGGTITTCLWRSTLNCCVTLKHQFWAQNIQGRNSSSPPDLQDGPKALAPRSQLLCSLLLLTQVQTRHRRFSVNDTHPEPFGVGLTLNTEGNKSALFQLFGGMWHPSPQWCLCACWQQSDCNTVKWIRPWLCFTLTIGLIYSESSFCVFHWSIISWKWIKVTYYQWPGKLVFTACVNSWGTLLYCVEPAFM